jgi:hypothetical protein
MEKFAIMGSKQGDRKDYPVMLIHNAFTADSENVQIWEGEVRSDKMRGKEIIAPDTNIMAHWKMDDAELQKVVVDSADAGNDGTSFNDITSASGKIDEAITFNGFDDKITIPDDPALRFGDTGFTLSLWFKTPMMPTVRGALWCKNGTGEEIILFIENGGKVGFTIACAGEGKSIYSNSQLNDNKWHSVIVTGEFGGQLTMYLDGVEQNETADLSAFSDFIVEDEVTIGTKTGTIYDYDGKLDDIRVYSEPLGRKEIDIINSGTAGPAAWSSLATPDGNPIIQYHTHSYFNGTAYTEYLLAFTKTNIYCWKSGDYEWASLKPASITLNECENWCVRTFKDGVVATNNIDTPLWWDGDTGTLFEGLGDAVNGPQISVGVYITRAKWCEVFENYINLYNISVTGDANYPNVKQWCSHRNQDDWLVGGGGDAGGTPVPGHGEIVCAGIKEDYEYVFKSRSTRKYWLIAGDLVWASVSHSDTIGCNAPGSVVNNSDSDLFYYASDMTFREIDAGKISYALDPVARKLNPNQQALNKMCSTYIQEYGEIWWSVCYSNATENERILKFSGSKWNEKDIGVTAFGKYNRITTWTIDTIPFDTIDEIGWESIDSVEGAEGFPTNICGDLDGFTWNCHQSNVDRGEEFTAEFVLSTDLANKQALGFKKGLIFARIFVRNEGGGTFNMHIAEDTGPFRLAGSFELDGTEDILILDLPNEDAGSEFYFAANHFLVKFSSTTPFRFVGVIFGFVPAGEY